jgi:hypothetical protein
MERLFYVVNVILPSGRTVLIVLHANVVGTHLDTHPHLSTAGRATQTTENVILEVMEFISFFQTKIARTIEGHLNVFDDRPRMRTHDKNSVRQVNRLLNIVGDKQDCARGFIPHFQQELLHFTARLRIESAEGLVHQDDCRAKGQRPGDRNALLHSARERFRIGVLKTAEADILNQSRHRKIEAVIQECASLKYLLEDLCKKRKKKTQR